MRPPLSPEAIQLALEHNPLEHNGIHRVLLTEELGKILGHWPDQAPGELVADRAGGRAAEDAPERAAPGPLRLQGLLVPQRGELAEVVAGVAQDGAGQGQHLGDQGGGGRQAGGVVRGVPPALGPQGHESLEGVGLSLVGRGPVAGTFLYIVTHIHVYILAYIHIYMYIYTPSFWGMICPV